MSAPTSITIAVAARKGGVGKTAAVVGLAHRLVSRGATVAIVDLDPQSNAALALGTDPLRPGSADLLLRKNPEAQEAHGITVYAGGPALDDPGLATRLDPEDLRAVRSTITAQYVLVDCPPGHAHLDRLALRAADWALIPYEPHPMAALGAERVLELLEQERSVGRQVPSAKRTALIIGRLDERQKRLHGHARELVRWEGTIFPLRWASPFAQALAFSQVPPECPATKDLDGILDWIQAG